MIQINEVELDSNLAEYATIDEVLLRFHELYPHYTRPEDLTYMDDSGCEVYHDDVQDVFNRYYDHYYDEIIKCAE